MASLSSVLAAFLPKVVLDCIERHVSPAELVWKVGALALCTVLLVAANNLLTAFCSTSMQIAENSFWRMQITDKIMDMDYHVFTRKGTRSKREKAMNSLMRSGAPGFIWVNIHLFSALFGFFAFTAIIVQCSFWFIPALIAGYALSALGWKALQKFRDKLKDEEARIRLRMDYVSQRSKDFAEAKDIRVYGMQPMLDHKAEAGLADRVALLHRIHTGHMLNTLLEDLLMLATTIGAYAYLIHLKLRTDMPLGDFALYLGAITGFGSWLTRLADAFSESLECGHAVSDYRSFLDIPDERSRTGARRKRSYETSSRSHSNLSPVAQCMSFTSPNSERWCQPPPPQLVNSALSSPWANTSRTASRRMASFLSISTFSVFSGIDTTASQPPSSRRVCTDHSPFQASPEFLRQSKR